LNKLGGGVQLNQNSAKIRAQVALLPQDSRKKSII